MPTIEEAHAAPARPDPQPVPMAIVLTETRVVRQGQMTYHVPAGSVIGIRVLPLVTTFDPGPDAKLIPAGSLKIGDIVAPIARLEERMLKTE